MTNNSHLKKLEDITRYQGRFTGKVVKAIVDDANLEKLKDFEKGDVVWVLKDSDFRDFIYALHNADAIDSNRIEIIVKAVKLIDSYERLLKNYDKQLLWLFNVIKEAQTAMIRFDDPNFVDDNIKELERKIYSND